MKPCMSKVVSSTIKLTVTRYGANYGSSPAARKLEGESHGNPAPDNSAHLHEAAPGEAGNLTGTSPVAEKDKGLMRQIL